MEIEDRYLNLINLLVYDKRTKQSGMICSIEIHNYFRGFFIDFRAMFGCDSYRNIFVEDFTKGNIVFLIPYDRYNDENFYKEIGENYKQRIKDFFGDSYREDMIMEISEKERQNEIKHFQTITDTLFWWNAKISRDKKWRNRKKS